MFSFPVLFRNFTLTYLVLLFSSSCVFFPPSSAFPSLCSPLFRLTPPLPYPLLCLPIHSLCSFVSSFRLPPSSSMFACVATLSSSVVVRIQRHRFSVLPRCVICGVSSCLAGVCFCFLFLLFLIDLHFALVCICFSSLVSTLFFVLVTCHGLPRFLRF